MKSILQLLARLQLKLAVALLATALVTVRLGSQGTVGVHNDLQAHMATRTAAFGAPTSFSFGVYSDIHMIENSSYGLTRAQWASLLSRWRDDGNLLGMVLGDLGYGNAADIDNVLSGPAAVPNAPPIFYSMGNHELDGVGKRRWIDALFPGAVQPGSWSNVPQLPPGNGDLAYYSFNIGARTHFIVMDGNYALYDGLNVRTRQSFGQAQLAWLAADIRANPDKNILLFVHEPIEQQPSGSTPYYQLTDRGSVLDLLAAHPKQAFVFSGHFHTFSGITRWRGVTSVHVMTGQDGTYGVRVVVNGDQITITGAGTGMVTEFDQHPMNRVTVENNLFVQRVAEDGAHAGYTRSPQMTVVGPENGVTPVAGNLMLKTTALTWLSPRFISEQLIKIQAGMKLSFDMYLLDVVGGNDAVTVQPGWYMKDGTMPPVIADQNGIRLSRKTTDGSYFLYNEDVPLLGGRATNRWYHREFDLTPMAGHYIDGLYLTSEANHVNVGTVYVDNIRLSSPAPQNNVPPTVLLTAPSAGTRGVEFATFNVSAIASDTDGSIARVDFFANAVKIGSRSAAPYSAVWNDVAPGIYNITAVATDNAGGSTRSAAVTVNVDYASGSLTQTLLTTQVPTGTYTSASNYELGTRVVSSVAGRIQSVRFWKAAGESGIHIGRIWSGITGQQLAAVTFANESASGWQEQALASPLPVDPNVEYLVSVNTTNGLYVGTPAAFGAGLVTGNLRAVAGSNGRYGSVGQYPLATYNSTNYFRDIVFVPSTWSTESTSSNDLVAPTVSFTQPANSATVSGVTSVSASASDNVAVTGVQFKVDGVNLGPEVTAPPYTVSWATTAFSSGANSLSATARDAAGNVATTSIVVMVAKGNAAQTLLTNQVPAGNYSSTANYELGVRLFSVVSGQITALRFWKVAGETGAHVGHVWTASGQLLATVTFANETASGWQQQPLPVPLTIQANTHYIVSVNTTNNLFAATVSAFASELVQGDLHAPVGSNGVYGAVNTFPTSTYAGTNYFRDIVFVANTAVSDTTAPTVAFSQPVNGASVSGTTTVAATAFDNLGVAGVQFKLNGVNFGAEVATSPYTVSWPTTTVPNGLHLLSATARDTTGNIATTAISVTVANGNAQQTLLSGQVPASSYSSTINYELGVRFFSDVPGQVTALRFWKVAAETGLHVGHVWTAAGQLLATVTFTNETASGWQQQALTTPVPILANTHYIVSVNTTNDVFPATVSALASEIVRGNLHAPAGQNGIYGAVNAFPISTYAGTNYFRDVVFVAGP